MTRHRAHARKGTPIAERLALHTVVAPSGCWVWLGTDNGRGYGQVQVNGKRLYVHRLSYELHVGPIPPGMEIDHLCRYPRCLNPRHLQAVTPTVNVRRGTSPGARSLRRERCSEGHLFAEHGAVRAGRRICRTCRRDYMREYHARNRAKLAGAA